MILIIEYIYISIQYTYICIQYIYLYTGWGKITSLNFKVNNQKTIRVTKILFLDSETTTWDVLNHVVLKRISLQVVVVIVNTLLQADSDISHYSVSISCGMRATSRRIASFSACSVLGRCLNTSAFRYPHMK